MSKMEKFLKEKEGGRVLLYCLVLSAVFLSICSRSSFLYSYNNWDDANSYFSMGKFMMNGGIIYRDLYDQKGPYLYLLYGLAYLISKDTFFGVFLMEIAAIAAFLYAGYKIMTLFCNRRTALILLPVLAMSTLTSLSFYWGGAAEEFCLPLLAWSLYMSLKYFKEDYPKMAASGMILVNGIFAGIIMQVKYTMLGFYFAWMAMMAMMHFTPANIKKSIGKCFIFLGGMVLTMIPWLIYFGLHGALDDWYQCYVYNNIFLYSDLNSEGTGLYSKLYDLAKILYNLLIDNFSYFLFVVVGMAALLFAKKRRWYEKVNVYAMFGFLFLGIFVGGANIFYYSIPLMVFAPIGLAMAGRAAEAVICRCKIRYRAYIIPAAVSSIVCIFCSFWLSMNTDYMRVKKEEHFLYRFKEIVEREDDPTLLNVNMLDAGLYTVADIVPSVKFFQTNGIAYEHMFLEQERYIREGITDFVICRFYYPDYIEDKYELLAEASFPTDGKNESTYYLFGRKE